MRWLTFISNLARLPNPVLSPEDLRRLPDGQAEALQRAGLLTETAASRWTNCDCRGHSAEVGYIGPKPFISCPECGLVEIDPAELRRFAVIFGPLASALAKCVGSDANATEVVSERLWRLGHRYIAKATREVWLARGLDWPDATGVFKAVGTTLAPVVIALGHIPEAPPMPIKKECFFDAAQFAVFSPDGASVHWDAIESRLATDPLWAPQKTAPNHSRIAGDITRLTEALKEHIRRARDAAVNCRDYGKSLKLLPRPTQVQLGKLAGIKGKSRINRAINDDSEAGRYLRGLYDNIATDVEEVLKFR